MSTVRIVFYQDLVSLHCTSQLYLEAPWHRLCSGHVWSAGSASSHPGRRWVSTSFSCLSGVQCIFVASPWKTLAHSLTLSFRLHLLLFRGHGFQLLQPAHEENESKLPTWRSHGHSLCQHALSNPGGATPVTSAHSQATLNIIYYHNLSHYSCFWVCSDPPSPFPPLHRSWILNFLS